MRVIAGSARSVKLQTIDGLDTRPTTDRIKESLFNMMAFDLAECMFLDLFSGSGAIGIEALSRGAEKAIFVDHSSKCTEIIEKNLIHTKLNARAEILKMDAVEAIQHLKNNKFDIIFMDPPYQGGFEKTVLDAIVKFNILNEEGYIVVERSSQIPLPEIEGLQVMKDKEYKTTTMTFLRLEEKVC
ncbi:MAG: 16S rRNA (guanine(966)-N(2))-methyltransferase RsmD [Clostridiales bacterium]|nr:16S rRNA (guanine(966)-N(2))-methyltransferase RsmD [Clostridiales bacterium]